MQEKLEELRKLNEKFYDMFGRLFKNRKLLDDNKTYKYFGDRLFEQYKAEYEALKYNYEIVELPELERVKKRHKAFVPYRRRPWYLLFLVTFRNRAAKNIDREIYLELEEHFRKKEAALERLEAALDKADGAEQRTKAFDEPCEPEREEPKTEPKGNGQLPGQMTLDDVQAGKEPKKPKRG